MNQAVKKIFYFQLLVFSYLLICGSAFGESQKQDSVEQKNNPYTVIHSTDKNTYLLKGIEHQPLLRLLQVPLNVLAIVATYFQPSSYAILAGNYARNNPSRKPLLQTAIPIVKHTQRLAFIWQFYPVLRSYYADFTRYGAKAVAMDSRAYLTCGKRRGILPVYSDIPWLGQNFHLQVSVSYDASPILTIHRLENSGQSTPQSTLQEWGHLHQKMRDQAINTVSIHIENTAPRQLVVNLYKDEAPLESRRISIPDDRRPWDLELLSNWCNQSGESPVHSVFHKQTINAVVKVIGQPSEFQKNQNHSLVPAVVNKLYSSSRASILKLDEGEPSLRLASTDLSEEHAGYLWLVGNGISNSELSRLVNSRQSELVLQASSHQQILDFPAAITQLERLVAYHWLLPEINQWVGSTIRERLAQPEKHLPPALPDSLGSSAQRAVQKVEKEKANLYKLAVQSFPSGRSIETLRPLHNLFLKSFAMWMVSSDDLPMQVAGSPTPIEVITEHQVSIVAMANPKHLSKAQFNFRAFLITGETQSFYQSESDVSQRTTDILKSVNPMWALDQLELFFKENRIKSTTFAKVINYFMQFKGSNATVKAEDVRRRAYDIFSLINSSSWLFPVLGEKIKPIKIQGSGNKLNYKLTGWGRASRKAIKKYYAGLVRTGKFPYDINKYPSRTFQGNRITHADLFRLAHVKPETPREALNYMALLKGLDKARDMFENQMILDHNMTPEMEQIAEAEVAADDQNSAVTPLRVSESTYNAIKKDLELWQAITKTKHQETSQETVIELIKNNRLAWEHINNKKLSSPRVYLALLQNMPIGATTRNLGKLSNLNIFTSEDDVIDEKRVRVDEEELTTDERNGAKELVLNALQDPSKIKNSGLHPLSILVAVKQYQQGRGARGNQEWKVDNDIENGLEQAYLGSFGTNEPMGLRTVIAADISASQRNTPVSENSVLKNTDAAFAIISDWVRQEKEGDTDVVIYDGSSAYNMNHKLAGELSNVLKLLKALEEQQIDGASLIDICFLVDGTGSMDGEMDAVKEAISNISEKTHLFIEQLFPEYAGSKNALRTGLVIYRDYPPHHESESELDSGMREAIRRSLRDYPDRDRLVTAPLTHNYMMVIERLKREKAVGGYDFPEDVAGGLQEVHKMLWSSKAANLVIHILDAPPHGTEFHKDFVNAVGNKMEIADNYPFGYKGEVNPKESIKCLAEKGINYCMLATDDNLQTTFEVFKKSYKEGQEQSHQRVKSEATLVLLEKEDAKQEIIHHIKKQVEQSLTISKSFLMAQTQDDGSQSFTPLRRCGYACTAAIIQATQKKQTKDLFIIFTDGDDDTLNQVPEKLDAYREEVNPNARAVIISFSSSTANTEAFADREYILFWQGFTPEISSVIREWLNSGSNEQEEHEEENDMEKDE